MMETHNRFKRFKVLSVERSADSKILKLRHLSTGKVHECHLCGSWCHSYASEGDIVHVQSDKLCGNTYHVSDEHGLITSKPDTLIEPTTLSTSVYCMRRAWLRILMYAKPTFTNTTDESSLIGRIVHDIFQKACVKKLYSLAQLKQIKNECLQRDSVVKNSLLSGINMEQLERRVSEFLPSILAWFEENLQDSSGKMYYQVKTVEDIEECTFSPSLGFWGFSDATCQVEIHSRPPRKVLVPLELKTGRAFTSYHYGHRTQAMTYAMGTKERGSNRNGSGLLLYLRNKRGEFKPEMCLIQMRRSDEVELLQKRNKLAHFLSPCKVDLEGPEFLDSRWHCDNCDVRFECSLMAASFEQDKIQTSSSFRQKIIHSELSHLRSEDIKFFKEWMHLLKMKQKVEEDKITPYWSEPSSLREKKKRGLGNLNIRKISEDKITFQRNDLSKLEGLLRSFRDQKVIVSEDESCDSVTTKARLFTGYVLSSNSSDELEFEVNQTVQNFDYISKTYRLDIASYGNLYPQCFGNLVHLMSLGEGPQKDSLSELRNAIICRSKRSHHDTKNQDAQIACTKAKDEQHSSKVLNGMKNLILANRIPNFDEKIVEIVKASLESGESILISSHSYASLDKILCKLKNCGIDFVRSGPRDSIHSDIVTFSVADKMPKGPESKRILRLKKFYNEIRVDGIKCSDAPDNLFLNTRRFDICIIDEADRIPLPLILNILFISDRFFLIGDENQPSNEPNDESNVAKYGESLFKTLLKKSSITILPDQYHMNREIMTYSNKLFYQNTLRCGSQDIAEAVIPKASKSSGWAWLDKVLSSDLSQSFLFLDTDHVEDLKTGNIQREANTLEAELCLKMVKEFVQNNGISPAKIGILSPFRAQVSLLRKMVTRIKIGQKEILVDTIDKPHQEGRMIILISFVKRGNSKDAILSDARRFRIALTRAARKLVFIGSKSFLKLHKPFDNLFNLMREEQFVPVHDALN